MIDQRIRRGMTAAVLVAASLPACTSESRAGTSQRGGETVVDTIGGTAWTRNVAEPQWRSAEQWTIREDFRIGTPNGEPHTIFSGIGHLVSRAPDGRLYVLDGQTATVRLYTGEGAFVREFAGKGYGPGELLKPMAMATDSAGLLWVASFNSRYTVFDSTGAVVRTVARSLRSSARLQYALHFRSDGSFIDERGTATEVVLSRVRDDGTPLQESAGIPHPSRPPEILKLPVRSGSPFRNALPFLPRVVWALADDGTVWSAETHSYRLVNRTFEGDTLRVVETAHRPRRLDPADRDVVERGLVEVGHRDLMDAFATHRVHRVIPLHDGHVLVQVPGDLDEPGAEFDVFDRDGVFLGTVVAPFAIPQRSAPAIWGDTIAAVVLDEASVPVLVRATIQRGTTNGRH